MIHEQKDLTSTAVRSHDFAAFLDIRDRHVVLIGGGARAATKLSRLLAGGATVQLLAMQITETLRIQLCAHVIHHARQWQANDLVDACIVVAAADTEEENTAISNAAHSTGCWINVANQPDKSNFLIPSLVDRSPLKVAISSGGSSPVLARLITGRIEAFLPHTYSDLGKLAERHRERMRKQIGDWRLRRRFWERLLSGRTGELILQGRTTQADEALEKAIVAYQSEDLQGEVYLVGAGPGDPDLLSFRALRLMQQCDIVLYDRLVSEAIMALVNPDAERVYVGKRRSDHAVAQESINEQLVVHAAQGKRVLRLKGGDPFIFGRGGEEIETLAAEGVQFQVVPGITAAAGCASYAGIPLTHRDHAQACLFVTGHLKDGSVDLDWEALVRPQQTVVIYMGLLGLPVICKQLIKHGLPTDHPIALIAEGTRHNQQVLTGTLESLPGKVHPNSIKPPTLIIVGSVVQLRDKLAWFETRH